MVFKVLKIDHIGVAVRDLDESAKFWENIIGLNITATETVESQKVTTAFMPTGDSELELLAATADDSAVAKFIENKGEGIQHLALRVDNIENALADLKAAGVRLIDEVPRPGAGGAKIAFLHPKSTGGILLELCQRD
ncbi:MAG: methylmalonyl-CoA epimerase [Clostridia bacterium]|nr:methylmalonyl-CoA epimerase [Clostridia bacterium]